MKAEEERKADDEVVQACADEIFQVLQKHDCAMVSQPFYAGRSEATTVFFGDLVKAGLIDAKTIIIRKRKDD